MTTTSTSDRTSSSAEETARAFHSLARLEAERVAPAPEADRWTLARRLALDLVGLPPTFDEARAFVLDSAPDAYERYVDRLLASPHYGERWAAVWLDLARYADSKGHGSDPLRPRWTRAAI